MIKFCRSSLELVVEQSGIEIFHLGQSDTKKQCFHWFPKVFSKLASFSQDLSSPQTSHGVRWRQNVCTANCPMPTGPDLAALLGFPEGVRQAGNLWIVEVWQKWRLSLGCFFSFALVILGNFDGNVLWSWGKKSLRRPVDYRKTTCLNRSLAGWQVLFTDGPLLCFRFGHFPDPLRFFQFIEHIRVFTTHIYSQLSTTNFNLIQWDANRHLACVHLICTIYRIFNHISVYYIFTCLLPDFSIFCPRFHSISWYQLY